MSGRTVMATVEAHRQLEGAGFEVRRPFPTPRLSLVDPFLLLDEMGPTELAPGEGKGAPDHPHRGFETVTYMISGASEHEDSAGNRGRIGPGAVQWMTAGAGVIHSEMPARELLTEGGRMHGFQLWVNLPAAQKMIAPRYQEFLAAEIPAVVDDGVVVRVIAGQHAGVRGPVETHSPVTYLHVTLPAGRQVTVDIPADQTAMIYTFAGDGDGTLRIYDHDGDTLGLTNHGTEPSEHLVLAGEALHEPVARYGPFVMNTSDEIEQAITDYQTGQFGGDRKVSDHSTSVVVEGLRFPEGPRWHEDRLVFSDQHDTKVWSMTVDGALTKIIDVPQRPSGLGWDPAGRMLIVSMDDRRLLRLDGTELTEVADLSALASWHCNDMVVDSVGRAYVGNFGFDLDTPGTAPVTVPLIRVDPDGSIHRAAEDLRFPNGTVITPDGDTLIIGESYAGCLTAFDVAADGALTGRRVWAKLEGAVPDGICLDAEGAIWSACPLSGRVLRVKEGGAVTDIVTVDRRGAYACMLGGPHRTTLYICTADASNPAETGPMRGAIEACEVAVPGAGLP